MSRRRGVDEVVIETNTSGYDTSDSRFAVYTRRGDVTSYAGAEGVQIDSVPPPR